MIKEGIDFNYFFSITLQNLVDKSKPNRIKLILKISRNPSSGIIILGYE